MKIKELDFGAKYKFYISSDISTIAMTISACVNTIEPMSFEIIFSVTSGKYYYHRYESYVQHKKLQAAIKSVCNTIKYIFSMLFIFLKSL